MSIGYSNINYAFGNIYFASSNSYSQAYRTADYEIALPSKEELYISTEMGWPVEEVNVSSGWGYRESCARCSTYHQGLDFTPGEGTNVLAAMNGVVKEINHGGEYGVYVVLEHLVNGQQWETLYAHLQYNSVPAELTVGQEIFIGDKIGAVGSTGLATGPHLHFEVRVNGIKKNPWPLLIENTKQS